MPHLAVLMMSTLTVGGAAPAAPAVTFAAKAGGSLLTMPVVRDPSLPAATPMDTVIGNVRVQAISPTLVRIEMKGPKGFEDRATFTVVNRGKHEEDPKIVKSEAHTTLVFKNYKVVVPVKMGDTLSGIQVKSLKGDTLCTLSKEPLKKRFLPRPPEKIRSFKICDRPRLIPPPWGATPPPAGNKLHPETSGWDTSNDAPDVYIFVPGDGGYKVLRKDFLNLTGKIPMPPKWAFGFWDSRYYPYSDEKALGTIDDYRKRGLPLDGFVVDTDWRVNGSHGYEVDKRYFPDMKDFLHDAHVKNVHLMFNDHPEPVADSALAPKEMAYRAKGLNSLLALGIDAWWYDRNWHTHLLEPMPGIAKEVWGQAMFHDITLRARPDRRPLIMTNVEGIDNGVLKSAPHPAGHRYPIMWTGDTSATWRDLERGISNGVDSGVLSLLPYVNEDLGGHHLTPSPELYVRFLQYGAFSPIMRVHCDRSGNRHPWAFGSEAEAITRDYVNLRYRLLPTLYTAARRAYDDGTPIMRRCDLEWPQFTEAADSQQFMFGDDILVAPINDGDIGRSNSVGTRTVWLPPGEWQNVWTGETLHGERQIEVSSPLSQMPIFVRLAGIVFLAPEAQHTSDKPWDPITIDAYPPSRDGSIERVLYEDDGSSNEYLNGSGRWTKVSLKRTGDRITLIISPAEGKFKKMLKRRGWVARIHLPNGTSATVTDSGGADIDLLDPQKEEVAMPFLGPRSNPGPLSGPVLEADYAAGPLSIRRVLKIKIEH